MRSIVRIIFTLLMTAGAIGAAGAIAGCKNNPQATTTGTGKPAPTTQPTHRAMHTNIREQPQWDETSVRLSAEPVAVAQGPMPLLHLFDNGVTVRVVDLTTQSALLPSTNIAGRTIVRVDERNGVTVGTTNVVPGPLPADHQYGIYVDPQTPNVQRQGIGPARKMSQL